MGVDEKEAELEVVFLELAYLVVARVVVLAKGQLLKLSLAQQVSAAWASDVLRMLPPLTDFWGALEQPFQIHRMHEVLDRLTDFWGALEQPFQIHRMHEVLDRLNYGQWMRQQVQNYVTTVGVKVPNLVAVGQVVAAL
eukprot:s5619_g3.t1